MISLAPATEEHARELGRNLRAADELEMNALGYRGADAVLGSWRASEKVFAVLADEGPIALFGTRPERQTALGESDIGVVWFLTAESFPRHRRAAFVFAKRVMPLLQGEYRLLVNWVDARYPEALRWAQRLGFQLSGPHPHGRNGEPFFLAVRSK